MQSTKSESTGGQYFNKKIELLLSYDIAQNSSFLLGNADKNEQMLPEGQRQNIH